MEKISKTVNIWNYISFIDQKIRSDGINNLLNYVLIKNEKKKCPVLYIACFGVWKIWDNKMSI